AGLAGLLALRARPVDAGQPGRADREVEAGRRGSAVDPARLILVAEADADVAAGSAADVHAAGHSAADVRVLAVLAVGDQAVEDLEVTGVWVRLRARRRILGQAGRPAGGPVLDQALGDVTRVAIARHLVRGHGPPVGERAAE